MEKQAVAATFTEEIEGENDLLSEKEAKITIISYSRDSYEEIETASSSECSRYLSKRDVLWVDMDSTSDPECLKGIGEVFKLHPLTIEDIENAQERPKTEDFSNYMFIPVRLPHNHDQESPIDMDQVNIILGSNYVLTIHDSGDVFNPIRQRIKEHRGRIRDMKADYLAYAVIDLTVDKYFPLMESIAERIESLDDDLQENVSSDIVRKIQGIKHNLILIRSSIWPMREVINRLNIGGSKLIGDDMRIYLRDIYDHTIQIADIVESYRDILSEIFNIHLSKVANNTNEVMKILTIFSTIFIPLTFIVGIYGMNFDFMPELRWKPAYFILLGIMLLISIGMLRFFRKRGWI